MSWEELLPDAVLKPGTSAVSVTINKISGRFKQRMIVTIRVKALDTAQTSVFAGISQWCKPGGPVEVQLGTGSDAGSYRLRPAGPWKFRNSAGHIKAVSISLPAPRGAPSDGCKQRPVKFVVERNQLQFTLPPWGVDAARSSSPGARRESSPPPLPSDAPARYVGISERVPDPAKAVQLAHGGRVR